MKTIVKSFGTHENIEYDEIFIEKENEFVMSFSDLGARINSWQILNEEGGFESITLGFDDAKHAFGGAGYYYGATIGRVAGRIGHGQSELEGKKYTLPKNDGEHHLHGGDKSFDLRKWNYSIKESAGQVAITFELLDEAGTNGYPGNLTVQVTHTITEANEWSISYKAQADKTTLFNPTNHVYFNLNGTVSETIENHTFKLNASHYLPVDADDLPLGKKASVEGTAFDLRNSQKFGDLLGSGDSQFSIHQGYDHPFVLGQEDTYQGVIQVPEKYRALYFRTGEPIVVIYTQNYTPDKMKIWGQDLQCYAGFTLEAQKEPDAINHADLSSIVLEKGQVYESQTSYWLEAIDKGES